MWWCLLVLGSGGSGLSGGGLLILDSGGSGL